MRINIKNKVQLNVMVSADTKVQLQQCAEKHGIKANEAMEIAIARFHADGKNSNLSAKTSVRQLSEDLKSLRRLVEQVDVKLSCLYDES